MDDVSAVETALRLRPVLALSFTPRLFGKQRSNDFLTMIVTFIVDSRQLKYQKST